MRFNGETEHVMEDGEHSKAGEEPTREQLIAMERRMLADLRLKRLQRAAEYALLTSLHLFFLLAFREFYRWWMALLLALITFGANFQLTQQREQRRTGPVESRRRIMADAFESILFLVFIAALSAGGLLQHVIDMTEQEYLAYVAALLGGLFMAGLVGELYWQARHYSRLNRGRRHNYVENMKRTIILPYTAARRRRK